MEEIVSCLKEREELVLTDEIRNKLLSISARTIDRVLEGEKRDWRIGGRKRTKPGSLLKSQSPVRTFAQWDEKNPDL